MVSSRRERRRGALCSSSSRSRTTVNAGSCAPARKCVHGFRQYSSADLYAARLTDDSRGCVTSSDDVIQSADQSRHIQRVHTAPRLAQTAETNAIIMTIRAGNPGPKGRPAPGTPIVIEIAPITSAASPRSIKRHQIPQKVISLSGLLTMLSPQEANRNLQQVNLELVLTWSWRLSSAWTNFSILDANGFASSPRGEPRTKPSPESSHRTRAKGSDSASS